MTNKVGRPKSDNPKNMTLRIRLDKQDYNFVKEYSEKHNIPQTETIRRAIKKLSEDLGE